VCEGEKARL